MVVSSKEERITLRVGVPGAILLNLGPVYRNGIWRGHATLLCSQVRQPLSPPSHMRIDPGPVCL